MCIGNSFSEDTTRRLAEIALSVGIEKIKVGNLFVPGCSINKHFLHATNDMPVYRYDINEGTGWVRTPNYKISDAVKSDNWDWISIQHGTHDRSRYTEKNRISAFPSLLNM